MGSELTVQWLGLRQSRTEYAVEQPLHFGQPNSRVRLQAVRIEDVHRHKVVRHTHQRSTLQTRSGCTGVICAGTPTGSDNVLVRNIGEGASWRRGIVATRRATHFTLQCVILFRFLLRAAKLLGAQAPMTAALSLLPILPIGFDQSPPHPPSHPPLVPVAPECDGSCFFISEYVEPANSSQDGFLELYNGCNGPVNLRDYLLLLCRDGCESPSSAGWSNGIPPAALPISLASTDQEIAPGSLFSIVYCEQVHTSRCANHNLVSLASSYFTDLGDGNGVPPAVPCQGAEE